MNWNWNGMMSCLRSYSLAETHSTIAETHSFTSHFYSDPQYKLPRPTRHYWDPQYKLPRPTALLGPTAQIAETLSTNLGTEFERTGSRFLHRRENRKSEFGFGSIHSCNAHFPGGGPFLRRHKGPNGHSSAPIATFTLYAVAVIENQVRLTHLVRL